MDRDTTPLGEAIAAGAIKPDLISCSAGCKRAVEEPEKVGWEFLPISRRWRCPDCTRELDQVNRFVNT